MGATLFTRGRNGPACNARGDDVPGSLTGPCRDVGAWLQRACGLTHDPPAPRQHRWTDPRPHRRPAGHVSGALAPVSPAPAWAVPEGLGLLSDLLPLRSVLAFDAWRCRRLERGL
jgi:hypothetical protein